METILKTAEINQKKAFDIIDKIGLVKCWETIGATINLIGSLKTGLLMTHRDIDFHIYTETLDISESFKAIMLLAINPRIIHIEYTNLIETDEKCIEWHAWYSDEDNLTWQIDMMHILKGSKYDGFFEKMTDRINAVITEEQRHMILKLKYETPENLKINGVEYYKAVIKDNINNFSDFLLWRDKQSTNGIIEWIP